ncbi:hypothetical protein A2533_00100 [Candidatus Falkowbacteria bacterium RIFOXYD2_FULL_35_9]|uniref:Peptidase C39-like domain-containing protein n=1 Tax=Candidatus Falkowbacteria bacterium RIFOXYC2_FULL_36_12 TaxID=1798002 RepID=A0A1F5SZG2_9BACT|nr:MAG: hypothetical protein A2300_03295 [Candidatus Falkowbacteria bacterium RIFOXYB2_FULL_35_7]OGF31843.1 MAG: hypothetical protein A2478_05160 [Candidatus Falkowbacteria bacterium RIFOXYC2_FULL_36_12]OGF34634.1 MAG: hypothetical protein A2223_00610 [Candidatus Falkowbacteria bacterium RIFOXYA2_FULL_35_8]OGF45735.1 MAG: hypothetical protein A2533_00100 [Candidatus Falkowbacteria bacterium RIFOXYD2_FULL_35_9]
MKIIFIALIPFLLVGCLFQLPADKVDGDNPAVDQSEELLILPQVEIDNFSNQDPLVEETINLKSEESELEFPAVVKNKVAFASQAPYANWDLPYQEACEEASLINADKFFTHSDLTPAIMDEEIKKLVEWENTNLGLYSDTNINEVEKIAREYFGFNTEIIVNVSVDSIKKYLAEGKLIIAPFAGRELGNPNFTAPGPLYHMLVITGYDRNQFITNDVGTRKGENYKYKYQTLIDAIYDLPTIDNKVFRPYDDNTLSDEQKAQKMLGGNKTFLVVWK